MVFTAETLDGDTDSTSRDATIRDVSGDSSGAFVNLGSARRVTAALRGFFVTLAGSAIRPAALGVGVAGGTATFVRWVRFLGGGVEGASGAAAGGEGALRLRIVCVTGAVLWTGSSLGVGCALRREDRLVAAIFDDVVKLS